MSMKTIQQSINSLHETLREYIEATYHISDLSLIEARRLLLNEVGVIHQTPYLESTPKYELGESFSDMSGLASPILEAFGRVSQSESTELPRLIYDPPFRHQFEAVQGSLIKRRNLVIMTGTGSGKTECFLLPILGKLAREASQCPSTFLNSSAMRALILYPMNALVNDQLGRIRKLLGDPRLVALFKAWSGRPPRFGRYTSRTPYAGIRTVEKDKTKFKAIEEFYLDIEREMKESHNHNTTSRETSTNLYKSLKEHGKWPAKPDLRAWLGEKGENWQNPKTGQFLRANTQLDDTELLTRHEIQTTPPDLLVTNYSMLEYMLMRPIERTIFDKTRDFLEHNEKEDFLIVLDEAHLYRGAAGAEVSLLLRRLRDRLNVSDDRFKVICTTASFRDSNYAPEFGAQLSGLPTSSFDAISGALERRSNDAPGTRLDSAVLADIEVDRLSCANSSDEQFELIRPLVKHRQTAEGQNPYQTIFHALNDFPPLNRLINLTMQKAWPITKLVEQLFPDTSTELSSRAFTSLLALGSNAQETSDSAPILTCRVHNFFRGLPGIWICMDASCMQRENPSATDICGKLYSQPRESCVCGGRVLELFTCRNCGAAYARAYTDDLECPTMLWGEPGTRMQLNEDETAPLVPLDLLLEDPRVEDLAEPFDYDIETGRLNPSRLGTRTRTVHLMSERIQEYSSSANGMITGQFKPCAVCGKQAPHGNSYVQNHQTKGDQPFQALVSKQLHIQQPSTDNPTAFAPLQGRKVLVFSDSRQVAARLAPNLQRYSNQDSLRPLIIWGFQRLQKDQNLIQHISLEDLYFAVLLAAEEFKVRLRPELKDAESFDPSINSCEGNVDLLGMCFEYRSICPPRALLEQMVTTILNPFFGLEALALGSIVECKGRTEQLKNLPSISGLAETAKTKIELTRAWLRNWTQRGVWLSHMPNDWYQRQSSQGVSVRAHSGKFKAMKSVIREANHRKTFEKEWLPVLLENFTELIGQGGRRLLGRHLSLKFDGEWIHCRVCKSVHRPVTTVKHCLDCGNSDTSEIDANRDRVFLARKGYYRNPVTRALSNPTQPPIALVAAEHTAQLNSPQNDDIFSKAEENELLFQDIDLGNRVHSSTAIDVLSCTTTMEVGIDIGTLSGVALRNIPPARANYQQRAGRAGRRGNSTATVIAFGNVDSHDENFFNRPDGMIRGSVVDPILTLNNSDIVKRHIRAFLLQAYHQERILEVEDSVKQDLFSVLGTVQDFRSSSSVLNIHDFEMWLDQNRSTLKERIKAWIPNELSEVDKHSLLNEFPKDCINELEKAIGIEDSHCHDDEISGIETTTEAQVEAGDESAIHRVNGTHKFLDLLLYRGILPRYAFPTDVGTFHVFEKTESSSFKPRLLFAPQQSLTVALSQYAPGKEVWISGKCYRSGAIYSSHPSERHAAWSDRRVYEECGRCGFATAEQESIARLGETRTCPACKEADSFGPARHWIRPPGFAHPVDIDEVTSPDDLPEYSYATRAKLTMDTPDHSEAWKKYNDRLRLLTLRRHLLVSNTGPKNEGYTYCGNCGRIEPAATHAEDKTIQHTHRRPFPTPHHKRECDGQFTVPNLVLGTDFITDIALLSLQVHPYMTLMPGRTSTHLALRTVSEAIARAACDLLELEPGELMAEFRPALTQAGTLGHEAEIFLYDTLPGGAGFSAQLPELGVELFNRARDILRNCRSNCDASCYRCLRSFKNKIEHNLLDRHVGFYLLDYLITDRTSQFNTERLVSSSNLLMHDLRRQCTDETTFELSDSFNLGSYKAIAPIKATSIAGKQRLIVLLAPLLNRSNKTDENDLEDLSFDYPIVWQDELVVRGHLPSATQDVLRRVRS